MKRLSLPLEEYNQDLKTARRNGFNEANRRFVLILKQSKEDPQDAVCMIVEDFEDDQKKIDQMLELLNLTDVAKKMWSE